MAGLGAYPSGFVSLPLRKDRYIGAPVGNVFDNLLPDNRDIREKVAAQVGAGGIDAYSLLAVLGRDCVGALQFLPEGQEPGVAGVISGRPVVTNNTRRERHRNREAVDHATID